jgi:hypothetical protein
MRVAATANRQSGALLRLKRWRKRGALDGGDASRYLTNARRVDWSVTGYGNRSGLRSRARAGGGATLPRRLRLRPTWNRSWARKAKSGGMTYLWESEGARRAPSPEGSAGR